MEGNAALPASKGTNRGIGRQAGAAVLLLTGAILIGVVGYWRGIPVDVKPAVKLLAPLVWLLLAWLAGRQAVLKPYRSVLLAFFGLSTGLWLASLIDGWPLRWLGLSDASLPGNTVSKLSEAVPVVGSILLVNRLDGGDLGGLLLRRGRLGLSLALGLVTGALSILIFLAMGGQQALTYAGPQRLLAALPLLLTFALANGFMEELWFRGSLLPRFEAVLGSRLALVVTTLAFGALHVTASYASGAELIQYVATTLVLGLAWGYIAQHTRTLWGSVFSHAVGDVLVMLGFFTSLL